MDLKIKRKNWVGNIYQKFEAICQEVDDFVSKDTVKFVENHVQTVGESVKFFCSGVVQDILPPLVDPVKHAAQAVPLKQINSIEPYTRPIICIEEKPLDIDTKQSSVEKGLFDSTENCHKPSVAEVSLAKQFISPTSTYPTEEQDGDALISKNADIDVESHLDVQSHLDLDMHAQKNVMEERSPYEDLSSPEHKNLFEALLYGDLIDEKYYNETQAKVSRETLIIDLGSRSSPKEGILCNSVLKGDALICENADRGVEANVDSDMGVEKDVIEEVLFPSENLSSPEHRTLCKGSSYGEPNDEKHNNGILAEVSAETLISGLGISSCQKEGTLGNRFSDTVERVFSTSSTFRSSELDFSVVYCENKVEEMSLISCHRSQPGESDNLSDFSHASFTEEAEMICCNSIDSMSCLSEFSGGVSSSESFLALACDNKDADMGLASSNGILSLDSDDADTSTTDEAVFTAGSSLIKREQYCKCAQYETFMSSLEIGAEDNSTVDVADPSIETIDLSDKGKLDESCVIVEDKPLYAFACRETKFRSYKKIIQDAFASRKRLTKEYEQLAIWYEDIDSECSKHPILNTLSSIGTISLELKKSPTQDLCESEWELL